MKTITKILPAALMIEAEANDLLGIQIKSYASVAPAILSPAALPLKFRPLNRLPAVILSPEMRP